MTSSLASAEFISLFETKSQRVKGLAFHPTRPWLLASLHTGTIQLWDYRVRTLVDKFTEHDGPVRSVDFHPQQPMFVSGGDDHKIRVWSYKERRCLFTLSGHLDYIRTVQFHHEYPWILSCADDQTVRIWNWQSRQCIAVLAGHSHYVMSARFHPSEDLVVSASLDQTVRVWDISSLRKKAVVPQTPADDAQRLQQEIFGGGDANVKFVLEGHERGVNWASFHPTMPLLVSGADDRSLKLWRMNESKAWELDTLRGHFNNVSCALFHPRQDALISLSEDKTIRVWDLTKRVVVHTHRRENERFWYLVAHPKLNLFAAAHDTGLVLFKLQRERPPYALGQGSLLYVKDRFVRQFESANQRDTPLIALRGRGAPRELLLNTRDNAVLVTTTSADETAASSSAGSSASAASTLRYELFALPKAGTAPESVSSSASGSAMSVAWVKRQRFAVLVKPTLVHVLAPNGEVVKKITPPYPTDALLSAPLDCLLLRSDDRVTLFDVQQERVLAELKVSHVKAAHWQEAALSPDGPYVALMCKGALVIANRKLERVLSVPETLRLKSGAWDEQGTFLYTTAAHLKFALPPPPSFEKSASSASPNSALSKGDSGIVRTLDRPVYLAAAHSGRAVVTVLDRTCKVREVPIDVTEFAFKRALSQRRYDEVLRMVKGKALIGRAVVGYLERAGHPELALHFVQDPATRFELALAASHAKALDTALSAAQQLQDASTWRRLASAAMAQGEAAVAEKALQQTLDFERLSLLYFASGQSKALGKMLAIAQSKRHDAQAAHYNALLLGDVEARVRLLEQSGQLQLAYACAHAHGLDELARQVLERIPESERPSAPLPLRAPKLMMPPTPLLRADASSVSWPHTRANRSPFDALMAQAPQGPAAAMSSSGGASSAGSRLAAADEEGEGAGAGKAWGDEALELSDEEGEGTPKKSKAEPKEGDGWAGDEDSLDLDAELEAAAPQAAKSAQSSSAAVSMPTPGTARPEQWARASSLAADLVAAGQFDVALKLLHEQIGLVNAAPLKATVTQIFRARAALLPLNGGLPPLRSFLERSAENARDSLPKLALSLSSQIEKLSLGYKAFTAGSFTEALELFRGILHAIPLLVVNTRQEEKEVKEMVTICREYILGLATELKRKDLVAQNAEANATRALELAALFTHVQLQPKHAQLVLKLAMNAAAKAKNYASADDFARRLLETSPPPDVAELCEKVLRLCESKGLQDALKLNYDSRNPFVICAGTLQPIYKGSPSSSCPYCGASFIPNAKGRKCTVCQLSEIGRTASGLQTLLVSRR